MWNKYRSFFMLVRVRTEQIHFSFPLALFLLDQTFDVLSDLVWLWERVIPSGAIRIPRRSQSAGVTALDSDYAIIPSQVLQLCREVVTELRGYGNWRMVEVEAGEVRVYVDFV
jgi:hypothetical protein